MSMADKLQTVAENQQKVYDAGYAAGQSAGGDTDAAYQEGFDDGKQAEYDRFWDALQHNGEGTCDYRYMFFYWTDDAYNPKYPIRSTKVYMNAVYQNARLTNTLVDVDVSSAENAQSLFQHSLIHTIPKFIVGEQTVLTYAFDNAVKLVNITVEGKFGVSIDMHWSPLSRASVESVINALSDTAEGKTVSFKKTAVNAAFTADTWNALVATKPNWTVILV